MANFTGYKPATQARWGSQVEWDDPSKLPLGLASLARNSRYNAESVAMRYGLKRAIITGQASPIVGAAELKLVGAAPQKIPMLYDAGGRFWYESPQGSGTLVQVNPTVAALLPANQNAQITAGFTRAYLAFSDLKSGQSKPAVFDGTNKWLDPISDKQVADDWQANTVYRVGQIVAATPTNSHWFRCTTPGTTGNAQPVWNTGDGQTTNDNTVVWTEYTPNADVVCPPPSAPAIARSAGAGTYAANRDVYIIITYSSPAGESLPSASSKIVNTVLNDRVIVTSPTLPSWLSGLGVGFKPTQYKVYAADVATGTAAPLTTAYHLIATTNLATPTNVDATGAGAVPPVNPTATLSAVGNICAGQRYLFVIFKTRTGFETGYGVSAPILINPGSNGRQLFVGNIPVGPYNTIARIVVLTVAGTGNAGPFFYIDEDAFVDPGGGVGGILNTSTVINDNVTTSATFNFLDQYLANASEVTDFSKIIEVPPCSDIFFSETLNRLVYTGVVGYSSAHLLSEPGDPETIMIPGDEVEVAEDDGDRTVCWREMNHAQYSLKENSGHLVTPLQGVDPAQWPAEKLWGPEKPGQGGGCGPAGPRAVAITPNNTMLFAHRSGFYAFTGGSQPLHISREMRNTWKTINWAAQATIVVHVDENEKVIRIAVPTGVATKPNVILKLNYFHADGDQALFADPVIFAVRMGKFIPNPNGRKWSVDPIPVNHIVSMERDIAAGDQSVLQRQVLFCGQATGVVKMENPGVYHDEDDAGGAVGIDWKYQTTPTPNDALGRLQFGGVSVSALGAGQLNITAVKNDGTTVEVTKDTRVCNLTRVDQDDNPLPVADVAFDGIVHGQKSERWSLLFDNGAVVDAWAELHAATMWIRPIEAGRKA